MAKKKSKSAPKPGKIVQIAVSHDNNLFALDSKGYVYNYTLLRARRPGTQVGMWEPLSSLDVEHIVEPEEPEEEDEDEADDEEPDDVGDEDDD